MHTGYECLGRLQEPHWKRVCGESARSGDIALESPPRPILRSGVARGQCAGGEHSVQPTLATHGSLTPVQLRIVYRPLVGPNALLKNF